jgi:uncharacterized Zn finger protein
MAVTLAFTEADIRRAAGTKSFERGQGYLDEVEDLEIAGKEITASVYGSSKYRVRLTFGAEGLIADCTCPHSREGFFCKHSVAVGLSVLEMGDDLPRRIEATRAQRQALDSWLESLSKKELLAELSGLLDDDPDLRQRFELRAALANVDAEAVRRAVGELITPSRDYVGYNEAHNYAIDVHRAAAAIDDLIGAGGAEDAIEIACEAIALLSEALAYADDSSGVIVEAANELLDVHLRACEAAPPEPVWLGNYLVGLLLHDEYGIGPDLGDYADLLGDQGFARVRERIAAAYAEKPGDWRARHLMEILAQNGL